MESGGLARKAGTLGPKSTRERVRNRPGADARAAGAAGVGVGRALPRVRRVVRIFPTLSGRSRPG